MRTDATVLGLLLVMALLAGGCAKAPEPPPPAAPSPFTDEGERASAVITGDALRLAITEFSDDRFEGRGPGTKGDALARQWLATQMESIGLAPGGVNGTWEQPFELVGIESHLPKTWTFAANGKRAALAWWDDYIGSSGVQQSRIAIKDAEVVFVGYGIEAPEYDWNDYKGQDLNGKVLLMLNNDPDWDPALFAGTTRLYYGRWEYKYESAARHGAAGAIIVHTVPSAGYPWQVVQTSNSGVSFELPAGDEPRIQLKAWVTESGARELVALGGKDFDALVEAAKSRDFAPVSLGVRTSIGAKVGLQRTSSANVLGLVRGGDPALKDEVVVLTAHHDHLGIGEPDASGDRIYNGAEDNAAGVAQLLEIARALKALPQPPRRSVLLNFVGAEEQGLLGSQYYATHPTFPPGRIAAVLNYDGGNVWGRTRDVTYIGKGKTSLDPLVEAIAAKQGRAVKPDQLPDRGYFYRSDQFNFAKIGVPAFYTHTGLDFIGREGGWGKAQVEDHEARHYHQPSDEVSPEWVYDGMVEDAQLGFWLAYLVANADAMPTWTPGDEFEAARKKALAELALGQTP